MPRKQIQLSESTLKKISEAIFLAYTVEQAAYLGGISLSTLGRIRHTAIWVEIERRAAAMEKPYRQKVYKGLPGWQGAAWMLERKYPGQLSRPEIQLQLNTTANTTNNTLVISAETAANLKARNALLDDQLQKLVPPASRASLLAEQIASPGRPSDPDQLLGKTPSNSVVNEPSAAPATGTPEVADGDLKPNLPPTPNSVISSSNLEGTTDENLVENSRNSDPIPPGGIKRGRGRPPKSCKMHEIPVEIPQPKEPLEPLQTHVQNGPFPKKVGTENVAEIHPKGRGPGRKYGPLGELLPSKKEVREILAERARALEAEEKALKAARKAKLAAEPPVPKSRRKRVPPKIVLRPRVVRAMAGIADEPERAKLSRGKKRGAPARG